jgi:hypothetical protein
MRHIERTQNESVHQAEGYCVCANSQRHRDDGDSGKAGGLAQQANSKSHVLPERFEEMPTLLFVAILVELLISPKLNVGTTLGLCAGKTASLKIIGTMLYVRTQFLSDLSIELAPIAKKSTQRTKDAG